MSKRMSAGGVCPACKFDPACIYEASSEHVILQCEQFEMGFAESPVPAGNTAVRATQSSAYAGLCANCDNREACIYPKPEGGVWRCEEYA